MEKNKLILLSLIGLLLVGLMAGMVSAADSIVIVADDWISDGDSMNVTGTFDDENKNATSVNWTISDGTTTFYINTNTSTDAFGFNNTGVQVSMNISSFSDDLGADGYTVTATFLNSSGESLGSDTELVGIDNGLPVCSQSTLASNTEYDLSDGSLTVTVTCTDALSAILYLGGNSYTMTEKDDICTYDIGSVPATSYAVKLTTSDGLNTTSCTSLSGVVLSRASTGGGSVIIPSTGNQVITHDERTTQTVRKFDFSNIGAKLQALIQNIIALFQR